MQAGGIKPETGTTAPLIITTSCTLYTMGASRPMLSIITHFEYMIPHILKNAHSWQSIHVCSHPSGFAWHVCPTVDLRHVLPFPEPPFLFCVQSTAFLVWNLCQFHSPLSVSNKLCWKLSVQMFLCYLQPTCSLPSLQHCFVTFIDHHVWFCLYVSVCLTQLMKGAFFKSDLKGKLWMEDDSRGCLEDQKPNVSTWKGRRS